MTLLKQLQETTNSWWNQLKGKAATVKIEEVEPEQVLAELSPARARSLRNRLETLALPSPVLESLKSELEGAIAPWLEDRTTQNSLTILGNSVEGIARIVGSSIEQWHEESKPDLPLRVLHWRERPEDLHLLENRLVNQLGRGLIEHQKAVPEVVVIPNLSWCFLRSADGIEGIEYLCRTIARDRDRFWVLGCGNLAWLYLDLIAKIAAYAPNLYPLPKLDGEQLQAWLAPTIEELGINFESEQEPIPADKDIKQERDRQQSYFEKLATLSQGSSIIALKLFVQSLRLSEADSELCLADKPSLPDFPTLSPDAQYLLYSLLLHERITAAHLAESLGDEEMNVRSILESLRTSQIIERSANLFSVNPLHYTQLRERLDGNYFLMSDN